MSKELTAEQESLYRETLTRVLPYLVPGSSAVQAVVEFLVTGRFARSTEDTIDPDTQDILTDLRAGAYAVIRNVYGYTHYDVRGFRLRTDWLEELNADIDVYEACNANETHSPTP